TVFAAYEVFLNSLTSSTVDIWSHAKVPAKPDLGVCKTAWQTLRNAARDPVLRFPQEDSIDALRHLRNKIAHGELGHALKLRPQALTSFDVGRKFDDDLIAKLEPLDGYASHNPKSKLICGFAYEEIHKHAKRIVIGVELPNFAIDVMRENAE